MSTPTNVKFYTLQSNNFYDLQDSEGLTNLINTTRNPTNGNLLVVDVYANWCQPCKYVAPKFESLSKSHPDVNFAKVNIDNLSPQQGQEYGITALPTFLYFKDGKYVNKVMGANISDIVDKIMTYKL